MRMYFLNILLNISWIFCLMYLSYFVWGDEMTFIFHLHTYIFTCVFLYLSEMKLLHEIIARKDMCFINQRILQVRTTEFSVQNSQIYGQETVTHKFMQHEKYSWEIKYHVTNSYPLSTRGINFHKIDCPLNLFSWMQIFHILRGFYLFSWMVKI